MSIVSVAWLPGIDVSMVFGISSIVMAALQVNPLNVFEVMFDLGDNAAQQVTALVVIINRAFWRPLYWHAERKFRLG